MSAVAGRIEWCRKVNLVGGYNYITVRRPLRVVRDTSLSAKCRPAGGSSTHGLRLGRD